MIKPAEARAMAPVVRFARLESCGSEEEEDDGVVVWEMAITLVGVRRLDRKTCWRRALRVEK